MQLLLFPFLRKLSHLADYDVYTIPSTWRRSIRMGNAAFSVASGVFFVARFWGANCATIVPVVAAMRHTRTLVEQIQAYFQSKEKSNILTSGGFLCHQLLSYSRTTEHVMQLECSLPCSQYSAIGSYPEPDESSPYHPILFLYDAP
jgi:hypothetical protein